MIAQQVITHKDYSTTAYQCRKAGPATKRTSEILFIDKWYELNQTLEQFREYAKKARGLCLYSSQQIFCPCNLL